MFSETQKTNLEEVVNSCILQRLNPIDTEHVQLVDVDLIDFLHQQGLSILYPDFNNWYRNKVIPGFLSGERLIHVVRYAHAIYGASIVKLSSTETKLCNAMVAPEMRKLGIGRKLLETTMQAARETVVSRGCSSKIIATIPADIIDFEAHKYAFLFDLLGDFGFSVEGMSEKRYREGISEYVLSANLYNKASQ